MRHVLMIAYTGYSRDSRVIREAEALAKQGKHQVTVFVPREGSGARCYEQRGVKVRESRLPKYQGNNFPMYFLSYILFSLLSFWECTKRVARGKADVVHVHNMPNFLVFGALPVKLRRGKIILDIHDTMPETYAAKFSKKWGGILQKFLVLEERICTWLADAVIAVNEPQAEVLALRGLPGDKMTVVMNVPDDSLFDYGTNTAKRDSGNSFRTVYHGTITRRNGVDQAINAVAQLKDKIPGIQFHILGSGNDSEEFRHLVQELDAGSFIHFHGTMPLEEIIVFLKDMDLEIVTSRRNPASELVLPVKLMESIALGIPVVTARLKTIESYFSEDMVYYFDPDDFDTLPDALLEAYCDENSRGIKAQTAKRFLDKYGWSTHKNGLLSLYDRFAAE